MCIRDRTLYFFVTPHILADEDFADLAALSYEKKLEAAAIMGTDRVRLIDDRFGESELGDTDHYQLPLYQVPTAGEVSGDEVGLDPVETQEMFDNSPSGGF